MKNTIYRSHYNSKERKFQKTLNNRINITMAFQHNVRWCNLEEPDRIHIKLSDEEKKQLKSI